jgi:hypothetical protein
VTTQAGSGGHEYMDNIRSCRHDDVCLGVGAERTHGTVHVDAMGEQARFHGAQLQRAATECNELMVQEHLCGGATMSLRTPVAA